MTISKILLTALLLTSFTGAALAQPTPVVKTAPKIWGDTDGDGRLSRAEYDVNADKTFKRLDADHDGFVSVDERAAADAKRAAKVNGTPDAADKKTFLGKMFGQKTE